MGTSFGYYCYTPFLEKSRVALLTGHSHLAGKFVVGRIACNVLIVISQGGHIVHCALHGQPQSAALLGANLVLQTQLPSETYIRRPLVPAVLCFLLL